METKSPYAWTDLHGKTIRHEVVNCDYLLLLVGVDSHNDYFQAFATNQMSHRLWQVPKTLDEVELELESHNIRIVGE